MKTKFFSFCLVSRTQISNAYIITRVYLHYIITYIPGSPK